MSKKHIMAVALALACATATAQAQKLLPLKNQPPTGVGIGFVLTDGRVLYQGQDETDWYTLTPDAAGQYITGTWKQVAPLPNGYAPLYFASAVLADGRVVVTGGEYLHTSFAFSNKGAIYDPVTNTWTVLAPPKGWHFIGDSPCAVLADGRFLLGSKFDKRVAALDPKTLKWTELSSKGKSDFNAEEGWTLLPDSTVLTYDVKNAPNSEQYDPVAQQWHTLGSTVANLAGPPYVKIVKYGNNKVYHPPGEVGPAILRPDGTVFATGATNKGAVAAHTAIYTPGSGGTAGSWAAGPDFASDDQAGDSYAALLPSGNVLVEADNGALYEFDGTVFSRTKYDTGGGASLIVLPTGEVLVGGGEVYRSTGTPQPGWAPVITSSPPAVNRGATYALSGRQFNGLSQANAYGDENQTATNYPLVRLTNTSSGAVVFARTHDHSTMGVATGSAIVSTHFDVPATAAPGPSTLEVIASGIASAAVNVTIQ